VRIGTRGGQFIRFNFRAASMPAGKPCRPHADAQAGQEQTKAGCLEAQLKGLGSNGWSNERGRDSRHPQPDLETMSEHRTSDSGQPPLEAITGPLLWAQARALFLRNLFYRAYH
jgi:hypothetical protein